MSIALDKAIVARLSGVEVLTGKAQVAQVALLQLLGTLTIPGSPPSVMFGNYNNIGQAFPAITFRPAGGTPDGRFADGLEMDDSLYAFEVWDNQRSAVAVETIDGLVRQLLNMGMGLAPQLPVGSFTSPVSETMYWSESTTLPMVHFDNVIKCWCSMCIYRFVKATYYL